jgi:RNA polymerase sigma factor (sigma-70 family)
MTTPLKQKIRDLLRLCQKRGHSAQEAEDLVHDSWEATELYGKGHEVHNPDAFMTTTVMNRSTTAIRRAARFPSVPIKDGDEDPEDSAGGTVLFELGSGPEEICSIEQRLEQYEKLLLHELGKRKCDLFFYQRSGHTYREVALEFDLSERTVRKYIEQAMIVLINHRAGEQE